MWKPPSSFLNSARESYRRAGFEVETIRIVTQPFPRYTAAMKRADAIALLRKLDELAAKSGFAPNIGTAMVGDGDDTAPLDLLAEALATTRLNASLAIAGEDGVHWRAIREAARLVKNVAARSPHGRGNLNFAVTAMVKPYGPFYPGAYHLGAGHTFAVGLEGASVVAGVLRNTASRARPRSSSRRRWAGTCGTPRTWPWDCGQERMDLCGHRPHARAVGRRLHRPRH